MSHLLKNERRKGFEGVRKRCKVGAFAPILRGIFREKKGGEEVFEGDITFSQCRKTQ